MINGITDEEIAESQKRIRERAVRIFFGKTPLILDVEFMQSLLKQDCRHSDFEPPVDQNGRRSGVDRREGRR